jgi:hypothetical protein
VLALYLSNYGFNEAFKKPFDVALLAEGIKTLVEYRPGSSLRESPGRFL